MTTPNGNSFTGINAGTSSATFALTAGSFTVSAHPGASAPGQFNGLCSLQVQQVTPHPTTPGVKLTSSNGWAAVGDSTDFQRPGSTTLKLPSGTYRFTATRTAASLASVVPAT